MGIRRVKALMNLRLAMVLILVAVSVLVVVAISSGESSDVAVNSNSPTISESASGDNPTVISPALGGDATATTLINPGIEVANGASTDVRDTQQDENSAPLSGDLGGVISISSTFEQACGVDTRLTSGNIVNVSTNAQAQRAINAATPGTVIRLAAGVYSGGLTIENVSGTADNPIVIEAAEGAYREARIENPGGMGIRIANSSHLEVRNLQITDARFGIFAVGLEHGVIENNHIHDLIWKGIQVSQIHTGTKVTGRPSSNVQISCNLVHDTGIPDGYENGHNGEGIYVGSGFAAGDRTNGVTVSYNEVFNTTGEAIELKPLITNSKVLFNKVHNVTLVDEGNGGAIAAQLTRELLGETDIAGDPNVEIRGNRIWNVSRLDSAFKKEGGSGDWRWSAANAIRIGGPVTITDNIIWNTRDAGIKIQDIYKKNGLFNEVEVSNNIIFNASTNPLSNTGAIVNDHGVLNVNLNNNITDDQFNGPITGDADEGRDLVPTQSGFEHLDDTYFW